jgi:hypothetical protein
MKMHGTFFLGNSEEMLALTTKTHSCGLKPVTLCMDVLYERESYPSLSQCNNVLNNLEKLNLQVTDERR